MGLTASRRCDTDREAIPVWKQQEYPLLVSSYWHCAPQKHMEITALPLTRHGIHFEAAENVMVEFLVVKLWYIVC